MDIKKFIEEIKALSVVELNSLVKAIEEEFGVTAAAPQAAAAAAAAPVAEEKTEFTVVLTETGDKKIEVIKVVRELTGLGLVEAKGLVDKAPSTIKDGVAKDLAKQMVDKLIAAGAKAEAK